MEFIAYRVFIAELSRLQQLSLVTPFSFEETREKLIELIKKPNFDRDTKIFFSKDLKDSLPVFQVVHRLEGQAPRYLRELLFTRAISALELFLIDLIKEVGKISPEKFKSKDNISLSMEKLLSFSSISNLWESIIEKDCRQLSSAGFQEITKYYRKLGIDYRSLYPGLNVLEEYHERRHLLIHKLGQVDDLYRHRHNSEEKRLSVDAPYLSKVFSDMNKFALVLNTTVIKDLLGVLPVDIAGMQRCLFILETGEEKSIPNCLKPTYKFIVDNNIIILDSLIVSNKFKDQKLILALQGKKEVISSYLKQVGSFCRYNKIPLKYMNPKNNVKFF